MGKMMKRLVYTLTAAILSLVLMYVLLRVCSASLLGYSWQEMDWNSDGITTFGELLDASDVGKRVITKDGQTCIEYFAYKDGLAVKVSCTGAAELP